MTIAITGTDLKNPTGKVIKLLNILEAVSYTHLDVCKRQVQSVSASVGGAIGPTTTALVAATAEKTGKESEIYRYTILPTAVTATVLGLAGLLAV